MAAHQVQCLLMGGQACVFYGAAEFSRAKMRGVDPFDQLWERRTTLELVDGSACHLLAVPDLVKAKKTQRDKDWPMIRRLIEAHHFEFREAVTPERLDFWLLELRTAELLIELAQNQPDHSLRCVSQRPLLQHAIQGQHEALERALLEEELTERAADRQYWLPLKKEFEALRKDRTP